MRAITTGMAVWREKYTGTKACCREANCGRGRAWKETMPPMNDWKVSIDKSEDVDGAAMLEKCCFQVVCHSCREIRVNDL